MRAHEQVRYQVINLLGGARRYQVEGAFAFVFKSIACEPNLVELAAAIREADQASPWNDPTIQPQFAHLASIQELSVGEILAHPHTQEMLVRFQIHPGVNNVRKAQIYAYERYLANIAGELALKKFPGVTEVRSLLRVTSVTHCMCS